MNISLKYSLYIACLVITGCSSIGPKEIYINRQIYNDVVHDTGEQQLLTNIVRTRYIEVTQWIQVSSLVASYSLRSGLSGQIGAITANAPNVVASSLAPTMTYSDSPTISYTPLDDNTFAKSLMKAVPLVDVIILANAMGANEAILIWMMCQQLNDINSDLLNIGTHQMETQGSKRFAHAVLLLYQLHKHGAFHPPTVVSYKKNIGFLFSFRNNRDSSPDALELKKILSLPSQSKDIIFFGKNPDRTLSEKDGFLVAHHTEAKLKNVVYVRTRSIYAVLRKLGGGVHVPLDHLKKHITKEIVYPNGLKDDPSLKVTDFFVVYSSKKEPKKDVLVKIMFHNYWFYIKDSDVVSKNTFASVFRLITLSMQHSESKGSSPVLTIPLA